jgi:hypothetical protein
MKRYFIKLMKNVQTKPTNCTVFGAPATVSIATFTAWRLWRRTGFTDAYQAIQIALLRQVPMVAHPGGQGGWLIWPTMIQKLRQVDP